MTFNEFVYFICGIVWGVWIIHPIIDIGKKIWKNAKEAHNGNNRKT